MTVTIRLFLVVLALVFFLLAGLGVPEHPRMHWIGFGLFFSALASIVSV